MLSARSPKYPGLHDEESGVQFRSNRPVKVTEEQALALAQRRYVDSILIGEFDEEGRAVNELPAKDWAKEHRRASEEDGESGAGSKSTDGATAVAKKTPRST